MFSIVRTTIGRICVAVAVCVASAGAILVSAGSAAADGGAPVVTLQPVDTTGYVDGTVQFTAAATAATTPSVWWEFSTDNGATWNGAGQYTDAYTLGSLIASEDGDLVRAGFSDADGFTYTSAARLTVLPAQPAVSLNPGSLSFGNQLTGTASDSQAITITNVGTRPLSLANAYSNTVRFLVAGDACAGMSLAPQASCTISVSFYPNVDGPIDGVLIVPDNVAPGDQELIDLDGYGAEAPTLGADASVGGLAGSAFRYPLSVGGDPAPTLSVSAGALPPGLTLGSDDAIAGTPTAAGTYQATLEASNGVGSPAYQTLTFAIAARVRLRLLPASLVEGNRGTTLMTFSYQLAHPAQAPGSFAFRTKSGTATAGSDYIRTSGTVSIAAGSTGGQLTVPIKGDTRVEPDEQFTVVLSAPSGVLLATRSAVGTILNDD